MLYISHNIKERAIIAFKEYKIFITVKSLLELVRNVKVELTLNVKQQESREILPLTGKHYTFSLKILSQQANLTK